MSRFDWPSFLRQNRIEFVTSGPNTARNHISCRCPFCGEADPSQHLGISLDGRGWGCLRNAAHRGKSPVRLIRQLLRCSEAEAKRIVGGAEATAPTLSSFEASVAALRGSATTLQPEPEIDLHFPKEFKPLANGSPLSQPFIGYLESRGYRTAQIKWLAQNYGLQYATRGLYAHRIIIPIYDRYGDLLSWTARTISSETQPRYRTLRMKSDDGGSVAKLAANNTVLGLPVLYGADNPRALVVVEGPFDALKVTAFGQGLGVYATSLFGLNVYPSQVAELQQLAPRFDRVYLLIDEDAELQRLRLLQSLSSVRCITLKMPVGSDDPGALSGGQVVELAMNLQE